MPRRTLLILDDHTLFREGLAWLVRAHFPGVRVLGVGLQEDLSATLPADLPSLGPRDLLALELSVRDAQPLRRLEACRDRWPHTPMIALLERNGAPLLAPLQAAGIDGVIARTARPQAVQELLQGLWRRRRRAPREELAMAGTLPQLDALPQPVPAGGRILPAQLPAPGVTPILCTSPALQDDLAGLGLSPRQFDVLRLMVAGQSNKQISRALGLAESTVKTHVLSLFQKLGLGSRTEVVVWAGAQGLPATAGAAWPAAVPIPAPDLPAGRPCC
ncbi:MAG: response regulator transcription factor [Burkholderiaceae bacterium]|nr:response regulator transcription factor [Burkholderiaceae bacterium]